jgi:hypothetical protein
MLLVIVCGLTLFACHHKQEVDGELTIEWQEQLKGDYAFAKAWDYPEGVYKNSYGQVSCDGFCPPETDAMKDSTGRIYKDSLSAFYALVDTTHRFHSLQGEAQCDEYAGADYMIAQRKHDTVVCYSLCNAATHCSLHLRIIGDHCRAEVKLLSIAGGNTRTYRCKSGFIRIDRGAWKQDTLKAEFDMAFEKDSLSGKPVSWKGKTDTPILKE